MHVRTDPQLLTDASKDHPVLLVVQTQGAAGTPNIFIGGDQTSLALNGLEIAPGGASPQITVTSPYYIQCDTTGGTTQETVVNINRL
jgi:hypothetical protein